MTPPDSAINRAVEAARMAYHDWCVANEKRDPWPYTRGIEEAVRAALKTLGRSYIDWQIGEPVALAQCPIGLFRFGDTLVLKTEYRGDEGRIDAYIVESGEFFWGDPPQTVKSQRAQIVYPVTPPAWGETQPVSDAYLIKNRRPGEFWLAPGKGTTFNVREAHRYTRAQAMEAIGGEETIYTVIHESQADTLARTATGQCAYFPEPCRSVSSCMRTGKCIRQAEAEQVTDADRHDPEGCLLKGVCRLTGECLHGACRWHDTDIKTQIARTATDDAATKPPPGFEREITQDEMYDCYGGTVSFARAATDGEHEAQEMRAPSATTREHPWWTLRLLVDKAWQEATGSSDTPTTKMADEIIEAVFGTCAAPAISLPTSTHETPGAAVPAGGATDRLPYINSSRFPGCVSRAGFRRFEGEEARSICEAEGKCAFPGSDCPNAPPKTPTVESLEDRIAALEKRPTWTEAKEALLRQLAADFASQQMSYRPRYDLLVRLIKAALPEPKP
jgi:hypothetical protein